MFSVYQHVLPLARAWRTTIDKPLTRFIKGLGAAARDVRGVFDDTYDDVSPQATRNLSPYEDQFGLPYTGLPEQERRDRLDAAWKAQGGQSPAHIQRVLQANGFDVYAHDWWAPGTEPGVGVKACTTPRNPLGHLRLEFTQVNLLVECGEALAECGEEFAECGNSSEPKGYPLVNKVAENAPDVIAGCGEDFMACGEEFAACGQFTDFTQVPKNYIVPTDPAKWPFFIYIGGETFGDLARVPPSRKDEFEALALKVCPAHLWLGVLVEYN